MRTRVSIYALAIHDDAILLTRLAPFCYRAGHWTLPGGGMDHGERPEQTLIREVHEETSLDASNLELFHVHSFSEDTRDGPFLAVQIVYRATALGTPRVLDVGGSTIESRWVPLAEVAALPRVPVLDAVLERLRAG